MKKEILECNLKHLQKVLQFDDLLIDQNSHQHDYIFYKIKKLIKSDKCESDNEIYSLTAKEEENDRALKIFKELKIEIYIEKSLEKLNKTKEKDVLKFSESIIARMDKFQKTFDTKNSKRYITLILFLFIFPFISISQVNIFSKDEKQTTTLENNTIVTFGIADMAYSFQLKDKSTEDGTYFLQGCTKESNANNLACTTIGLKSNNNLIWGFYYAVIYDKDGFYTDNVYAGYIKTEFGEQTSRYLIKVKKTRLYPENNIYTESITFSNGITMIIEDKIFVRRIELPDKKTLYVANYYYKDCGNH